MEKELVTLKIPRELHRRLSVLAARMGKKLGAMAADILRKAVK